MTVRMELELVEKDWLSNSINNHLICGVAALILDKADKVLLLLRKKEPQAGHWTIPGGKLKFFEDFRSAILRELKEEIGVDVEIIDLLVNTHPIDVVHGKIRRWFSPVYLVKIKDGTPKNLEPDAHETLTWFPLLGVPENINMTTKAAFEAYETYRASHV